MQYKFCKLCWKNCIYFLFFILIIDRFPPASLLLIDNVFLMFKIESPRHQVWCYCDTMQCFVFNFVLPCWVLWNFLVRWELVTSLANKKRCISRTTNKVWVLGSSLSMTDGFLLLLVMAVEIGGGGVKDWCQKEYPSLNFFKTTNV